MPLFAPYVALFRGKTSIIYGNHFREPYIAYGAHFEVKNGNIGPENTCFWDANL
jgi:hypothetical protein